MSYMYFMVYTAFPVAGGDDFRLVFQIFSRCLFHVRCLRRHFRHLASFYIRFGHLTVLVISTFVKVVEGFSGSDDDGSFSGRLLDHSE